MSTASRTSANAHDPFFLQGWMHAEDRMFQMDVTRRRASGTLAELLGSSALASDVQLRRFGLRRTAEQTLPLLSSETQRELAAYADGVNAWLARNELPGQYASVQVTKVAPWPATGRSTPRSSPRPPPCARCSAPGSTPAR